jgi:hypothetical protein
MIRLLRMAGGLAVFLIAAVFSASLTLGPPSLPGLAYHVFFPIGAFVVISLSFAGSYFLIKDARKSK